MLPLVQLHKTYKALKRNSNFKLEIRELPLGARQPKARSELTLEQPAEDVILCRFGRKSLRRKGRT